MPANVTNSAVAKLTKQFGELSNHVARMAANMDKLSNFMEKMAQLSGRLTASLMIMSGAPRPFGHSVSQFLAGSNVGGTGAMARSGLHLHDPSSMVAREANRMFASEFVKKNVALQDPAKVVEELATKFGHLLDSSTLTAWRDTAKNMQAATENQKNAARAARAGRKDYDTKADINAALPYKPKRRALNLPARGGEDVSNRLMEADQAGLLEQDMLAGSMRFVRGRIAGKTALRRRGAPLTSLNTPSPGRTPTYKEAMAGFEGAPMSPFYASAFGLSKVTTLSQANVADVDGPVELDHRRRTMLATHGPSKVPPNRDSVWGGWQNASPATQALAKSWATSAQQKQQLTKLFKETISSGFSSSKTIIGNVFKSGLLATGLAGGYIARRVHGSAEAMQGTRSFAPAALGGIAMGAGLLGAALPDALATVTGSFQLLAAQLGTALIPYSIDLSQKIQDLTYWYAGLSDSTKSVIAKFMVGGLALGGLVLVIPKIVSAASALITAFGAIGPMMSAALSPMGLAVAGLGAAVAITTIALREYQKSIAEKVATTDRHRRGDVTEEELKATGLDKILNNKDITDEERAKQLEDIVNKEKENFANIQKEHDAFDARGGNIGRGFRRLLPSGLDDIEARGAASANRGNLAGELLRRIEQGKEFKPLGEGELPNGERGAIRQQLLVAMQANKATPQYSGVEDIHRKIQVSALADDPITREMRRIHEENMEQWRQQLGKEDALLARLDAMGAR